jgi:hypothetical protein
MVTTIGGIGLCPLTRQIRQYTKWVLPGAQRIGASSANTAVRPTGFVNVDGKMVAAVAVDTAGTFTVSGLAAGVYGRTYTIEDATTTAADVTISAGQSVSVFMPGAGVFTVYAKGGGPPAVHRPRRSQRSRR